MKFLVADDHAVVRRGLKQILADAFAKATIGEASTTADALQLALSQRWDLVLLDITMPGRSGLDVLKDLKQQRPQLPVLILSVHPEDQYAVRVLKAGADGYLTKESATDDLIKAIRRVLDGGKYISPPLAEKLAADLRMDSHGPLHEMLSDREYQVLCMIGSGKMVKEIAGELSLSVKTISTYRARILEKMKMKTTADLVRYAVQYDLVQRDTA